MDLVKKTREITINDDNFIMAFDMRSVAEYSELTGKSFVSSIDKLFNYDDATILNFIACTLRRKEEPEKPLGKEVLEGDILYYLLNHHRDVINLVVESLPSNDGKK